MKDNKLSYYEAVKSPCEACSSSPCCYLFQLDLVTVNNLMDLDTINYYLNFDNIDICLSPGGEWTVYYNYPCRFYVKEKSICTLHATPQKPGICVHYNPYYCFYKKSKSTGPDRQQGVIWINRERMDAVMARVSFDEDRYLIDLPEKEHLYRELSGIPYSGPNPAAAPTEDKAAAEWKHSVISGTGLPEETVVKSHLDFRSPCGDCDSYCCKNLMFPTQIPATYSSLDYIIYALGFPGIELGISNDQWYINVKTTCAYLDGAQCSLYGKRERPLVCKFANPNHCFHRACFSLPKPNGFMRIGFEEFNWLLENFKFDNFGNILEYPEVGLLRSHIESKWLETTGERGENHVQAKK
jgi:hypothetical protein